MSNVRTRLVAIGLLIACLMSVLTVQFLERSHSNEVDRKLDRRSIEIASFLSSVPDSPETMELALDSIAQSSDVMSLIVVDGESGDVVASSQEGGRDLRSIEQLADGLARVAEDSSVSPYSIDRSARLASIRSTPSETASTPLVAVVDFDRDAVGAGYPSLRRAAVIATLAASAAVLLAVFVAYGGGVERRLRSASERIQLVAGVAEDDGERDALARLEFAVDRLVRRTDSREPAATVIVDQLPEMWIRFDEQLAILEAHAQTDEGGPVTLDGIENLADLLSDAVIAHVRTVTSQLDSGDVARFEFTTGHRGYETTLTSHDSGSFELSIAEARGAVIESTFEIDKNSEMLDQLLGQLPFTLMELDDRGTVRWANAGFVGREPVELIGHPINDVVPQAAARVVRDVLRDAIESQHAIEFTVETALEGRQRRWSSVAAPYHDGHSIRILIASLEVPELEQSTADPASLRRLEEQLWTSELRVSELEAQVEEANDRIASAGRAVRLSDEKLAALRDQLVDPLRAVVQSTAGINGAAPAGGLAPHAAALRVAVEQLTAVIDAEFGTAFSASIDAGYRPAQQRFHVATFLDEIAIAASEDAARAIGRISVRVQPSLPNWLFGDVTATRLGIHRMIEIARLVASDRPLTLVARQDTSTGRSVQVRFEVEIPPPKLDQQALEVVRGCLAGDESILSGSLIEFSETVMLPDFEPLDVELLASEDGASVLRCSSAFDIAEEPESDHSWIRGLRTLIVQDPAALDSTIQSALGAFGIIGYVVSDEGDLVEALRLAEEYSNPYRFVIADVDTPDLDAFIGQLFDGEAPVVLVGPPSENAMVAALADGYAGYLPKPVRQVDLLEVILSTVEPPGQADPEFNADAA